MPISIMGSIAATCSVADDLINFPVETDENNPLTSSKSRILLELEEVVVVVGGCLTVMESDLSAKLREETAAIEGEVEELWRLIK